MSHGEESNLQPLDGSQILIEHLERHFDIIGNLPLELVQSIFLALPIHQAFQAQRVSRRWSKLLTTTQTVETLVRGWFRDDDTSLVIPNGSSAYDIASLKAEHINAYLNGKPFSKATVEMDHYCSGARFAYEDGRVCLNEKHTLLVWDLVSGKVKQYIPDSRVSFNRVAISASMVAAATSTGQCYVWTLPEAEALTFAHRPGYIEDLVISGSIVVILSKPSHLTITTWSLCDRTALQFNVPLLYSGFRKRTITLDHFTQSLALADISSAQKGCTKVRLRFFDLNGRIQGQREAEFPDMVQFHKSPSQQPLSKPDGFVPVLASLRITPENPEDWDSESDRFTTLQLLIDFRGERRLAKRNSGFTGFVQRASYDEPCFFWKSIVYCRATNTSGERGWVILNNQDAVCTIPYVMEDQLKIGPCKERLFGDERFLVRTTLWGFDAWCFDKYLHGCKPAERMVKPTRNNEGSRSISSDEPASLESLSLQWMPVSR